MPRNSICEIDDGSLDHILPKDVFMFGVAFGIIYACVDLRVWIGTLIQVPNLDRVLAHLRKHNYDFKLCVESEKYTKLYAWPKEKEPGPRGW